MRPFKNPWGCPFVPLMSLRETEYGIQDIVRTQRAQESCNPGDNT